MDEPWIGNAEHKFQPPPRYTEQVSAPPDALLTPQAARHLAGLGQSVAVGIIGSGNTVNAFIDTLGGVKRADCQGPETGIGGGSKQAISNMLQVPISGREALHIWSLEQFCQANLGKEEVNWWSPVPLVAVLVLLDLPASQSTWESVQQKAELLAELAVSGATWAILGVAGAGIASGGDKKELRSFAKELDCISLGSVTHDRSQLQTAMREFLERLACRAASGLLDLLPIDEDEISMCDSEYTMAFEDVSEEEEDTDKTHEGEDAVENEENIGIDKDTFLLSVAGDDTGEQDDDQDLLDLLPDVARASFSLPCNGSVSAAKVLELLPDVASASLPYNGDLSAAMRAQDRAAIRLLMEQRKSGSEEQNASGVVERDKDLVAQPMPLLTHGLSSQVARLSVSANNADGDDNDCDVSSNDAKVSEALGIIQKLVAATKQVSESPEDSHAGSAAAPPGTSFDCGICFSELTPEDLQLGCQGRCSQRFCTTCLSKHVEVLVSDRGVLPGCPGEGCEVLYTENDVESIFRQCVDMPDSEDNPMERTMRRFRLLLLRSGLAELGAFPCHACDEWMVAPETVDAQQALECPSCGELLCSLCRVGPHHFRCTCEELHQVLVDWEAWLLEGRQAYLRQFTGELLEEKLQKRMQALEEAQKRRRELEEMEQWKVQNCRLCPGCSRPIEKTGGCDSMVCGRDWHGGNAQGGCGHRFEWAHARAYTAQPVAPNPTERSGDDMPGCWRWAGPNGRALVCDVCREPLQGPRLICVNCPAFECCAFCAGEDAGLEMSPSSRQKSQRAGRWHRKNHAFRVLWSPLPGDESVVLAQDGPLLQAAEQVASSLLGSSAAWGRMEACRPEVERQCPSNYDVDVVMGVILAQPGEEVQAAHGLLGTRSEVTRLAELLRDRWAEAQRMVLAEEAAKPSIVVEEMNAVVKPFLPSSTFLGPKPSYVFKKGEYGLGYYLDDQMQPDADAVSAESLARRSRTVRFEGDEADNAGEGEGARRHVQGPHVRARPRLLSGAHCEVAHGLLLDLDERLLELGTVGGLLAALHEMMLEERAQVRLTRARRPDNEQTEEGSAPCVFPERTVMYSKLRLTPISPIRFQNGQQPCNSSPLTMVELSTGTGRYPCTCKRVGDNTGSFIVELPFRSADLHELSYLNIKSGHPQTPLCWRVEAARVKSRKCPWELFKEVNVEERGPRAVLNLSTGRDALRTLVLRVVTEKGAGGISLAELTAQEDVQQMLESVAVVGTDETVELHGLINSAHLNGCMGTVVSQDDTVEGVRLEVRLWLSGQLVRVRENNVRQPVGHHGDIMEKEQALHAFVKRHLSAELALRTKPGEAGAVRLLLRKTETVPLATWNMILWQQGVDWDDSQSDIVLARLDPSCRGAILLADLEACLNVARRQREERASLLAEEALEAESSPVLHRTRSATFPVEAEDLALPVRMRSSTMASSCFGSDAQPFITRMRSSPYREDVDLAMCLGGIKVLKLCGAEKRGKSGASSVSLMPRTLRLDRKSGWKLKWTSSSNDALSRLQRTFMVDSLLPLTEVRHLSYGWLPLALPTNNLPHSGGHQAQPWLCFSLLAARRSYDFVALSEKEAETWVVTLARQLGVEGLKTKRKFRIAKVKSKLRYAGGVHKCLLRGLCSLALERRIPFACAPD